MSDNVKIEIKPDNRQKVKRLIKTQLLLALEKCGMVGEGYAKDLCPVQTRPIPLFRSERKGGKWKIVEEEPK